MSLTLDEIIQRRRIRIIQKQDIIEKLLEQVKEEMDELEYFISKK